MEPKFVKKTLATWSLAKLHAHPRQCVFRPHTKAEIQALAESMEREGLNCPVEVTPDGKIVCGHGRVAAAKLLGWDKITVWIRRDLAEQGEDAVFRRLVEDNRNRRQLTKLGLGRAFLALKAQNNAERQEAEKVEAQGDYRDHLGELLGCDGTTAERWARLAVLPAEYDSLIENGLLTQRQADKIVNNLPTDIRERLGKKLTELSETDLPRKDKKRQIVNALNARLGKSGMRASRPEKSWLEKLNTALQSALKGIPEPIATFAAALEHRNEVSVVLRAIRRKYPEQIRNIHCSSEDMQTMDSDQIKRTVSLMLVLLEAAEPSSQD